MTEIFFVLTVIYAAYVIYSVASDSKKTKVIDDSAPAMMSVTTNIKPLIPEKAVAQPLLKPVAKTAKPAVKKSGLKNPETGEIVSSYANYRFMKRWIKEALVSEGLLEKIYKNNEVNVELEVKIKEAISQLENLDNYKI